MIAEAMQLLALLLQLGVCQPGVGTRSDGVQVQVAICALGQTVEPVQPETQQVPPAPLAPEPFDPKTGI